MIIEDVSTIKELAAQIDVTVEVLREKCRTGKLKAYKGFGKWFIFRADFLEALKDGRL